MAINYDKLMAWPSRTCAAITYTQQRDTMLYALASAWVPDPTNEAELRFVYEKNLVALPTLPVVLLSRHVAQGARHRVDCAPGARRTGPAPAPTRAPEGERCRIGRTRVTGIVDKGLGKGALDLHRAQWAQDAASGELLATLTSSTFCRADGGFGGPGSRQ